MKELVVVANKAEAKLFNWNQKELKWLKTVPNPEGREREHAFHDERPGMNASGGQAHAPYSLKAHEAHTDVVRDRSAKQIAQLIKEAYLRKEFESLTIIAEPHLLGSLRSEIKHHIHHLEPRTLAKRLKNFTNDELISYLEEKHETAV